MSDDTFDLMSALLEVFNVHRLRIDALRNEHNANLVRIKTLNSITEQLQETSRGSKEEHSSEAISALGQVVGQPADDGQHTPIEVLSEYSEYFPRIQTKEVHAKQTRTRPRHSKSVAKRCRSPQHVSSTPQEFWSARFP